jgi:RsiW-degrading membrane proteinase PrsW (M82 family)
MSAITPTMVFIALLGGILPSVFWLWFWLKEDERNPEPRGLILLAFLVGMLATALAYPIEKFIAEHVSGSSATLITLWAMTEESLKFIGISIVALHSKYFDEPIDAVIYFVTIALGFAALENAMFLFTPIGKSDALATMLLGNFRFIGATLLHVGASGLVGVMVAFSFYKTSMHRRLFAILGLIGAIALHTLFNFSIIVTEGAYLYEIFLALWVFVIGILLCCEKIKQLSPRSHVDYPHTGHIITIANKLI